MCKNILVVDDSALMRRVISDIISSDGRFRVIGEAEDGLEAIKKLVEENGKVDVMLLDINMAKMDGLEVLANMKKLHIDNVKVIVLSTLAVEGGGVTIEALARGAFDFVKKPYNTEDMQKGSFIKRLMERLTLATESKSIDSMYKKESSKTIIKKVPYNHNTVEHKKNVHRRSVDTKNGKNKKKLVFCACSTGGPNALHKIVPKLNEKIDAPMVIVQHMPKGFTKSLADRLNELSKIKVKEVSKGDILEKGTVYIAKGGSQLVLKENADGKVVCDLCVKENAVLKPCADVTLNSIKKLSYDKVICVVLTGMGKDATKGIVELSKNKEIYVIAQDRESSVVYGMPNAINNTGLVDEVVTLNDVAKAIINNTGVR